MCVTQRPTTVGQVDVPKISALKVAAARLNGATSGNNLTFYVSTHYAATIPAITAFGGCCRELWCVINLVYCFSVDIDQSPLHCRNNAPFG